MEHRWGERKTCQIPVRIEASACGRLGAHIENLSVSGAFLRIQIAETLPPTIFIQFAGKPGGPQRRHRILAFVVRQTVEGIGLEWADFAPLVIRTHLGTTPGAINAMRLIRASPRNHKLALAEGPERFVRAG
jgi:hypothetical protein